MQKTPRLSLRELEQETKRFGKPTTEKEAAIIKAAVELLGERGIDGATTAQIAKRAGVTEKTLFRYFPSKRDLVRRVLYPQLLAGGLSQEWQKFEALLGDQSADLETWYATFTKQRMGTISRNPGLARTLLTELVQNEELREQVARLWRQHIWRPMVQGLAALQTRGKIRKDIDVEMLARTIHYVNVGYFFARFVFAPGKDWNDDDQIAKMAALLAKGAGSGGD